MNATPERRPTPTERYHEAVLAFAARSAAPPEHAVEITRNAKGDFQFTVTVRGHDLAAVLGGALEVAGQLEARYPRTNGGAP